MNPGSKISRIFNVFPKKMRGKWRFCVASRRDSQRLLGSCEQSSVLGHLIGGFLRQKKRASNDREESHGQSQIDPKH